MMATSSNKIFSESQSTVYVLYRRRFYILGVFSFLSFNQCSFWLTFSPVSLSAQSYYNISSSTVDLLLNWGPIIFIPCLPLAYLLLNTRNGLRRTVIILAVACFVATLLRVIPSIAVSPSNPHFKKISLSFFHAGQIINAACGPLVMMPVSQLSCLWFGPNERARATTIAIMANVFGSTISFLINPAIVSKPSNLPYLLYFHVGLALVAGILTLAYFPAQPPKPPSHAAEILMNVENNNSDSGFKVYMKGLWQCIMNPSFVLLAIVGGVMTGTFSVWTSLFSTILNPENYTEQQAGWFGFASSLASIIGGFCLGALADSSRFRRSLKMLILIVLIACFIPIVWFQLSVRSVFYDAHVLGSTKYTIGLAATLVGLFQGAAAPLVYESLAEITYPLPESLSASVLVQLNNVTFLTLLFAVSGRYKIMNLLVVIAIGLSIVMAALARVSYKRRDEDERKKREGNDDTQLNNITSTIN
ncbi:unnamed protein product [Rotaria magnacalcarata]|uniref:Uncharacterized protein n=1 Tax=Rotaria magnacalcarata TaxID=392030 RepID=A0A814KH25_9BILA|nr:unnamed protein product [Rotaria magnacalcarata]CAF4486877.1 unnamed protein product [Rotaria magnacalcarata]